MMKRANGFIMIIPDGAEKAWSPKKIRQNELCYVCGKKCKAQGRSVPRLGRVCAKCFDQVIDAGVEKLMIIVENRPEFKIEEVESWYSNMEVL